MPDLFDKAAEQSVDRPLADRMRPVQLDEILGQDELIADGKPLRRLLGSGELPSMILWGPPGSGKTTLARVLATSVQAHFESVSAVMSGVKELRSLVAEARDRQKYNRGKSILFIDEIHRFNKAQQDALLPHVENGTIRLIGATTENPAFEVNAALLSRSRVFTLRPLDDASLQTLLERALNNEARGLGRLGITLDEEALALVARSAAGDARRALNNLELVCTASQVAGIEHARADDVVELLQNAALRYDKNAEEHYNVISAFIKSMRGSDPDAAVYYLARMLEAGESPRFILRRMVIFASEDIGNADPRALQVAVDAHRGFEFVGMPEGNLLLTQAVTYLACAPKSNAALRAYKAAAADVREHGALEVPMALRNAASNLQKELGYGAGYAYPHDAASGFVLEHHLPDALRDRTYYDPSPRGAETKLRDWLEQMRQARAEKRPIVDGKPGS